jgi:shikimate kinase
MMESEKNRNVILTGFRGTGKTTVGKLLAARLQWVFVDMDEQLTKRLGASIAEVVARHGWAFFRQAEAELMQEAQAMSCTVLATGGGAIEHQQEWQQLRNIGYVVWLDADIATIKQRLMADSVSAQQRPSLTGQAIQDEIGVLLERRLPMYRAGSDLRLAVDGKEPEELADQILQSVDLNEHPKQAD